MNEFRSPAWRVLLVGNATILLAGLVLVLIRLALPDSTWGEVAVNTGAGLIGAAGISLLWWFVLGKDSGVHPIIAKDPSAVPFDDYVAAATTNIDVSGITLTQVLANLSTCDPKKSAFRKIRHAPAIRLLFCHPMSDYLDSRFRYEGLPYIEKLRFDVWHSVAKAVLVKRAIENLAGTNVPSIKIRLRKDRDLPCTLFRTERTAVVGHYSTIGEGKQVYRLIVSGEDSIQRTPVFEQCSQDFANLWKESEDNQLLLFPADSQDHVVLDNQVLSGLGFAISPRERNAFEEDAIKPFLQRYPDDDMKSFVNKARQEVFQPAWEIIRRALGGLPLDEGTSRAAPRKGRST